VPGCESRLAGHHLLRRIIGLDAAQWLFNIEQVINQE
jgi:hypothetical protein